MEIKKFNTVDFIFNEAFRKWVFEPDNASDSFWKEFLEKYPEKKKTVHQAKHILLSYKNNPRSMDPVDSHSLWEKIVIDVHQEEIENIPIKKGNGTRVSLPKNRKKKHPWNPLPQWQAIAAILFVAFILGFLANSFFGRNDGELKEIPLVYNEHHTPKGVKSTFELPDGSRVRMNAGTTLRYQKGLEGTERKLYLEGEAFFEVKKNPLKPFSVINKKEIQITALGTSFMVQAYPGEEVTVTLISGEVLVGVGNESVILNKGEGLRIEKDLKSFKKLEMQEDLVMAWTEKTILFDKTPIVEAIRVLENWYGVEVFLLNKPPGDLLLTGRFKDKTLENVLEGLEYTAKVNYQIKADSVYIKFKQ